MHAHIWSKILRIVIIILALLVTWKIFKSIFEDDIKPDLDDRSDLPDLPKDDNYLGTFVTESRLGHFRKYAVSTDAKHCSPVGTKLLRQGGSAMDAAIGTLLCMGVVIPNSMGLGGGCLMTIYDTKTGQGLSINGREMAPHYAYEDMFGGDGMAASRGNRSIGIPGELAAYARGHELYGRLNWSSLFEDAIKMADEGAPMVAHLASALRDPKHSIYMSKALRATYINETTGLLLNEGDLLKNKPLAGTLRRIRDHGVREFYHGETGRRLIKDLAQQGGLMNMKDLEDYRVEEMEAMKIQLTPNLTLHTQPLPGSGIILSIILRIMRNLGYYDRRDVGLTERNASLYYHHLVESFKFAYAQRARLEDQPDDPARLARLMERLRSEQFIEEAVAKIDDRAHTDERYLMLDPKAEEDEKQDTLFAQDSGTAHVSVLDEDGLDVEVTTSVNLYFGSGLISKSTGIIYNDIMDDFVSPSVINKFGIPPSKFNRIRPGKRPLSSMAPSVFVDDQGKVRLVIGASGGTHITSGIAFTSLKNLYLGEDLKQAIDGRRIHHQYLPNQVTHEFGFPKAMIQSLEARGHTVRPLSGRGSVVMAVANQPNQLGQNFITANSDSRKGGSVDGL